MRTTKIRVIFSEEVIRMQKFLPNYIDNESLSIKGVAIGKINCDTMPNYLNNSIDYIRNKGKAISIYPEKYTIPILKWMIDAFENKNHNINTYNKAIDKIECDKSDAYEFLNELLSSLNSAKQLQKPYDFKIKQK